MLALAAVGVLSISTLGACGGSGSDPFSVVVLGNFRRFFFSLFSFLLPSLDFSFIYNKFLMPFRGFFYWKNFFDML